MFAPEQMPELQELVHSIRMRCATVEILSTNQNWWELIPTVLEDMAQDVQTLVFEFLQEKEGKGMEERHGVDKVETVAKLIEDRFRSPAESAGLVWDAHFNYILAHEILKLFPEYEPAELEALGDEEIEELIYSDKKRVVGWATYVSPRDRKITQATIQKNQAKGQLFRVRSEKERYVA